MIRERKAVRAIVLIILCLGVVCMGISGITMAQEKKIQQEEIQKKKEEKRKEANKKAAQEAELNTENDKQEQVEKPWYLAIVNRSHPMKKGYVPKLAIVQGEYQVDERIAEDTKAMLADARKAGLRMEICSAYRSVQKQESLFNASVSEDIRKGMTYWEAYQETTRSIALPGQSEHGMGLAIDIVSSDYPKLDEKQALTKEAKWLEENCYKYGFILRYPPKKWNETGITYEPWHYRYVGKEDAKIIMERGVTLEEYLEAGYECSVDETIAQ